MPFGCLPGAPGLVIYEEDVRGHASLHGANDPGLNVADSVRSWIMLIVESMLSKEISKLIHVSPGLQHEKCRCPIEQGHIFRHKPRMPVFHTLQFPYAAHAPTPREQPLTETFADS